MKLKDFLLKYLDRAIEIVSSEPSYKEFCGFALEIEKEMTKEGINEMAAARLFSPLYEIFALDGLEKEEGMFSRYKIVREALFDNEIDVLHERNNKEIFKWKLKEKTKNMSKEEKEKVIDGLIEENKDYYRTNIEKFNLELLSY